MNYRKFEYPLELAVFFDALQHKEEYCLSLSVFQNCLYSTTLTVDIWDCILQRRFNIDFIRQFRKEHNGQNPQENYCQKVMRTYKHRPDPYVFDYEVTEEMEPQVSEYILNNYLMVYKPFYDVPIIPVDKKAALKKNYKALTGTNSDANSIEELGMNLTTSDFFSANATPNESLPPPDPLPLTIVDHTLSQYELLEEKKNLIVPCKNIDDRVIIPTALKKYEEEMENIPGVVPDFN